MFQDVIEEEEEEEEEEDEVAKLKQLIGNRASPSGGN